MTTARGERGFTLLEVVVAFVIASISLAVLYGGTIEGSLGSRQAARTQEAVIRARSRLAALCYGARLSPGEQAGDDGGGYTWRSEIARVAAETAGRSESDPTPVSRADLFAVRVIVSWPGAIRPHRVAMDTRCLSGRPANPP